MFNVFNAGENVPRLAHSADTGLEIGGTDGADTVGGAGGADGEGEKEAGFADPQESESGDAGGETGSDGEAKPEGDAAPARDFERDAAYARMRRTAEESAREAAFLREENARTGKILGQYFGGEDPLAAAVAMAQGTDAAEVSRTLAAERELSTLRSELARVRSEKDMADVRRAMDDDLAEVRKIDPGVKSLADLGEEFFSLIGTGKVSASEAYYAMKAKAEREDKKPPAAPGKLGGGGQTKDFFTRDEVDAMTDDEMKTNHEKIMSSMRKWA